MILRHSMQRLLLPLAAVAAFIACRDEAPNPGFDFSAMAPFWAIQSALEADQDPPEEQWAGLLDTPGYQALTASEFTPEFFRNTFELAFRPSKIARRDSALAGPSGAYLSHYLHVAEQRAQLTEHLDSLQSNPVIPGIVLRAREFLPSDAVVGHPDVAFVIFANDARAYAPIVVDLQASRNWDFESFLAHEFHHWYRNQRLAVDFAAIDSLDYDLLWTLNQIQAEGIADLIDKRGWILQESAPPSGMGSYALRYLKNLEATPNLLQTLDSLIAGYRAAGSTRGEVGAGIRNLVPQSGHPTGFFMASLILEQLGVGALTANVGNPFAFVRTFNRAAERSRKPELLFSPLAVARLEELERKYVSR